MNFRRVYPSVWPGAKNYRQWQRYPYTQVKKGSDFLNAGNCKNEKVSRLWETSY